MNVPTIIIGRGPYASKSRPTKPPCNTSHNHDPSPDQSLQLISAGYMRERRQLTQKKKTHSWSEPIHAIVDEGRALSWCSWYHV